MADIQARRVVDEIVNGRTFAGRECVGYFTLPGDFLGGLPDVVPVLIYPLGGTETQIDRTDRVGVDVYAQGTAAVDVAEAISTALVNGGMPHSLEVGYVDGITVENSPTDVPYPTPGVFQAQAVFRVTSRL